MTKLADALVLATALHDGDYRKGSGLPFVVHPIRTGILLRNAYGNTALEIAGYLHDTVEDTDHTIEKIGDEFGYEIMRLVADVTKIPGKPWPHPTNPDSMRLKTADTLDNTTDVLNGMRNNQPVWDMFRRGKKKLHTWRMLYDDSFALLGGEEIVLRLGNVLDEIEQLMETL